ncbi:MAG TPA: GNAT family N-acetyltransferase [Burkholderiales bacterium]|nr:GNAT family N-acetyltransferase [Burkholderiales bacterium]
MRITVLDHPATLAAHRAAWNGLADAALEPNVFHEPWMMLPAIEAFGRGADLRYALVYADQGDAQPLLCGLFPLERVARYNGLPFSHLRLWRYKHCFLGTPLVRATHARACLGAFLDWLEADAQGAAAIKWGSVAADGPFWRALAEALAESGRRSFVPHRFERAMMRSRAGSEAFLGEAVSGKGAKELRRLERRLAEAGEVQYAELREADEAEHWIADFIELEERGWKGRNASALGSSDAGRMFFTRAARAAARQGRLMMLGLRLAGRWIALKCNLLSGEGSFAFKIAYDEDYARFSPGTLLELENIRRFHARPDLRWMDSCADPDHFMANRLWLDRRRLADLVTTTGRAAGDLMVSSLPLLHWMSRTLRRTPAAAAHGS